MSVPSAINTDNALAERGLGGTAPPPPPWHWPGLLLPRVPRRVPVVGDLETPLSLESNASSAFFFSLMT